MIAVLGGEDARTGRHRGRKSHFARNLELALPGRARVPDWEGKMPRPQVQHRGDAFETEFDLCAYRRLAGFAQHRMRVGVRADGDKWIGSERTQLVPAQAQF